MSDLSVAVLVGRLTRDAELKYTNSGQAICKFSVATSTRRKKGDEWIDEASFWDVELWGKQGESLNQYLTKGKQIAVHGTMRQDRWEQDQVQRMKVVVNADTVQLLGSKDQHAPQQSSKPTSTAPAAPAAPDPDEFSDDIPF